MRWQPWGLPPQQRAIDYRQTNIWTMRVCRAELQECTSGADYAELDKRVTAAIFDLLRCRRPRMPMDDLVAMVYVHRACTYLPLLGNDEKATAACAWLVEHPDVSRVLFRAIAAGRPQDRAKHMRSLIELLYAEPKMVEDYPDLAVAFAITDERRYEFPQPGAISKIDSFRWYTTPKRRFRSDLRQLPFELACYLADTRLSVAERELARQRYARAAAPAQCYFDVPYDDDSLKSGQRKIERVPFTLPNLLRFGGVCRDQAYFATEVCKAMGIPATVVVGRGKSGVYHAWVAALKLTPRGTPIEWDCRTGRYRQSLFYAGYVTDPVKGRQRIEDSELALISAATKLPLGDRELADAATTLAEMVHQHLQSNNSDPDAAAARKAKPQSLDDLQVLAERYNKRFPTSKKIDMTRRKGFRELDYDLVENLLTETLTHNLAHREAWGLIIQLAKDSNLQDKTVLNFANMLVTRTAGKFPDYSCDALLEILPTVDDDKLRRATYVKAAGIYRTRPDLQGRLLLALGDDYAKTSEKQQAYRCWNQAAIVAGNHVDTVLTAARNAEQFMTPAQTVAMYTSLYARADKSWKHNVARKQTAAYQLGQRLADLYEEHGNKPQADRIRRELNAPGK